MKDLKKTKSYIEEKRIVLYFLIVLTMFMLPAVCFSHVSKYNNYPESGSIAHKNNRLVIAHNGNWIDHDAS